MGVRSIKVNSGENCSAFLVSVAQPALDGTRENTAWRGMEIYDS